VTIGRKRYLRRRFDGDSTWSASFTLSLILVDRTQKVKDARSEAAKEVEAYKAQKEKDFKQFESAVLLFIALAMLIM
jgi:hypothetical protein